MNTKTRYLQLSDIIMLEYTFLGQDDPCAKEQVEGFLYTKLSDRHYAVFSPNYSEVETTIGIPGAKRKSFENIQTFNDINHLAVPKNDISSEWYTFLDPDYEYCGESTMKELPLSDRKVEQYAKYCSIPEGITPTEEDNPFVYKKFAQNMRWDTMKLYFVNGYDFSNIYAILARISLSRTDGKYLDLCNFFFTKTTAMSMLQYLAKPIIFGNSVYDRYIEVNTLCLYDILNTVSEEKVNDILKIKSDSNIRLNFSYINDEDYTVTELTNDLRGINSPEWNSELVNCDFVKGSSLSGVIPAENINSDNLGIYIAENSDSPYIEFYGTWKGEPLSFDIVQTFNRSVKLYDKSLIHKENGTYDVDKDYSPEINLRKWMAIHELEFSFMKDNTVLKTETYSMTQIFVDETQNIVKFYYRPVIFDESLSSLVTSISVKYDMRFINADDKVQFLKSGSLSITDTQRFYAKGSKIPVNDILPYKIYNKIVESKQDISGKVNISPKTKYVKVFYNSSDIILENDGRIYNTDVATVLQMSSAAKSYKFTFKKKVTEGKYDYFDLSGGGYKLYTKDSSGNPIIIDPTYSSNMNPVLGELEFNINTTTVNKLMQVSESDRKMSVVAYNDDNSISSMYDFTYSF